MRTRTRSSVKKQPNSKDLESKVDDVEATEVDVDKVRRTIKKSKTAKPKQALTRSSNKSLIQEKVKSVKKDSVEKESEEIEPGMQTEEKPEEKGGEIIEVITENMDDNVPMEEEQEETAQENNPIDEGKDDNNENMDEGGNKGPDQTNNFEEENPTMAIEEANEGQEDTQEVTEVPADNANAISYMDILDESNLKQIESLNAYSSNLASNSNRIIERQLQQAPYNYENGNEDRPLRVNFYDAEDDMEIRESIQEMMINLDKNPIALLNEYCSKAKQILEYRFQSEGIQKKQKFFCRAFLNKKPLHKESQSGKSKQEAKTESAKLAIMALSRDPKPRSILTNLLMKQRKTQISLNKVRRKDYNFETIDELMQDDNNLMHVMNTFAQNSKESLKWRMRMEGNVCVAELRIGQLTASAVKSSKKQAKLWAAKNMLKTINSNTFLKDKFLYFAKNLREINLRNTERLKEALLPSKEQEKVKKDMKDLKLTVFNTKERDIEAINSWFDILDCKIKLSDEKFKEVGMVFGDVSDILLNLFPGYGLRLIPVGSFLSGCMRNSKIQADGVIYDESLAFDVSMQKIRDSFYERRGSFQLINNTYHLYEARVETREGINCTELIFTRSVSNIEVRISTYKENGHEYNNLNSRLINKKNSIIYHTLWLEEFMNLNNMNRDVLKILRVVREWREIHQLSIPSEILDLGVFYSTSYFKEFDVIRVLIKFFALFNLLLNPYNFYFYELSEYHSFFFNSMKEKDKERVLEVAQSTFLSLSKNDPNEFLKRISLIQDSEVPQDQPSELQTSL